MKAHYKKHFSTSTGIIQSINKAKSGQKQTHA
jgi:hypothetical protein